MNTFELVAAVILALIAAVLVIMAGVRLGRARRATPGARAAAPAERSSPGWHEILLAVVVLAVLVILAITIAVEFAGGDAASGDWRAGTRSGLFLAVMLAMGALSLIFLAAYLAARLAGRPVPVTSGVPDDAGKPQTARDPAASRLAGLLLLVIGILLIGWVYLSPEARADLLLHVIYPAAIAVTIVLLFDKATRSWTPKTREEGFREWLLCDVLLIALVLGYLNLRQLGDVSAYGGFFWDMVHVAAVLFVFWCLDRTSVQGRFLVGFGYLTVAPLLLVLWRWVQEIETPPEPAWWSTIWPVFFLALAFFVLEIITLLVLRGSRGHAVPAIKDAVFVILFAVVLIAAVPDGA